MNCTETIKMLLNYLPDSNYHNDQSWRWAWEELDWELQDNVKAARKKAQAFLIHCSSKGLDTGWGAVYSALASAGFDHAAAAHIADLAEKETNEDHD